MHSKAIPRSMASTRASECASPRPSYGPFKLFSPRKGTPLYYFQPQSLFKRLVWRPQWHRLLPPCDFDARHRSGAEPTQPFAFQKALPGRKPSEVGLMPLAHLHRVDPEHLGVRPARGTRVHGSSCRTFCRRSRSTSITFPDEPRAMTRALGRVQGPRYRAARARA